MGWLLESAADFIADVVGWQVGRGRPWWVGFTAYLGCLAALGLMTFIVWLIFR